MNNILGIVEDVIDMCLFNICDWHHTGHWKSVGAICARLTVFYESCEDEVILKLAAITSAPIPCPRTTHGGVPS